MRTWAINGKYPFYNAEGKIESYEVTISSNGKYAAITETIKDPELMTKTNDEIVRLVLKQFSLSEFSEYHVSEAVQKVQNFDKRLIDAVEEIENIKDTYKQSMDDMSNSIRVSFEDIKKDYKSKIQNIENSITAINKKSEKISIIDDLKSNIESINSLINNIDNVTMKDLQKDVDSLLSRVVELENKSYNNNSVVVDDKDKDNKDKDNKDTDNKDKDKNDVSVVIEDN